MTGEWKDQGRDTKKMVLGEEAGGERVNEPRELGFNRKQYHSGRGSLGAIPPLPPPTRS